MRPTLVRVNKVPFSFYSCSFKIDNFPVSGVVSLEYEQKRTRKIIGSNTPGAAPLGRTNGFYSIPTFRMRLLREDAEQFMAYLADKSAITNSYGDASFTLTSQATEDGNVTTTTAIGYQCAIEGKKTVYDEGIGALIEEIEISALQLQESDANGLRYLYSTVANDLDGLAVDYITIEGNKSPGRATIIDPKRDFGWDVRQAYGFDNPTLVPKGSSPASFGIRFDFWEEDHLVQWNSFSKYFKRVVVPVPGNIPNLTKALTIVHPILQAQPFSVGQCVVKEISALNKDELGDWSCTVRFLEWGKPVPVPTKPSGAVDGPNKTKPDAKTKTQQATLDKEAYLEKLKKADADRTHKGQR